MGGIQIERYNYRRRRSGVNFGFGCLVFGLPIALIFACAGLYATGVLLPVILSIGGMERVGETDSLFESVTPQSTVSVQNPVSQSRVIVDLGAFGQEAIDTNPQAYAFIRGTDENGIDFITATFTESGLIDLCNRRGNICNGGDGQYRNAWVDLRSGGAVVYVDVNAGVFWQTVGVVLQFNAARTRIDVVGVDIDGTTYNPDTLPVFLGNETRGAIASALVEVETTSNEIMRQMVLTSGGESYRLMDVQVTDTLLTLIMR